MFAQDNRIYYSTDDGASWAVSTPFSSDAPGRPQAITFTNNSWVLCYSRSSQVRFRSCAASDITDWGDEVDADSMNHVTATNQNVKIASANGNVVAISEADKDINYFTVSGKTIGTVNKVTLTSTGSAKALATDGTTWVLACRTGDMWSSTDNGANWTQVLDGFNSAVDMSGVTCDVYLPL